MVGPTTRARLIIRIRAWKHKDPMLMRWSNFIHLLHPVVLAALVCSVLSGIWTSPSSSHIHTAYSLRRAGTILFLIVTSMIMGMVVRMMIKSKSKKQRFDILLVQVCVVTFILLIRIIYATVQAFLSTPQNPDHDTWVYLDLLLIPDCLAISIYTICGLVLKPSQPPSAGQRYVGDEAGVPSQISQSDQDAYEIESAQSAVGQEGKRRQRRIRGPIHMLIDAITGNHA